MPIQLGGHISSTPHLKLDESDRVWRGPGASVKNLGNGADQALVIGAEAGMPRIAATVDMYATAQTPEPHSWVKGGRRKQCGNLLTRAGTDFEQLGQQGDD